MGKEGAPMTEAHPRLHKLDDRQQVEIIIDDDTYLIIHFRENGQEYSKWIGASEALRERLSHSSAKSEAVLDELIQEIGSIVLLNGTAIETRKLILDIIKDKKSELRQQER